MVYTFNRSVNYLRIVVILVLAFIQSIHSSLAHAQKDLSALVKKVAPAVVVINILDKGGELKGIGTGFFVKEEGILVTNYHVIEGAVRAEAKISSGEILPIENILIDDREGDLALLSLGAKGRHFPTIKITDTKIEVGQPVMVIGSPLGLEGTVSDGIVSAVRDISNLGKILQITAPISKGSSGSPVLNMKGEVIGVATLYAKEGQNLNFAISADRVTSLLSSTSRQAKPKKFTDFFKEVREQFSESAEGLAILGNFSLFGGRYEEAIEYFKRSIKKRPNYAYALASLGATYIMVNRYVEAIEACKQAIWVEPDSYLGHFFLGMAYKGLGRYSEAIESLKQAIRAKPDDTLYPRYLGQTYYELGRYNEAVEAFKEAIRISPNDSVLYTCLGNAYFQLYHVSEAIESFKQAVRIKPNDALAHLHLGMAYIITDKSMAFEEYKILRDLDKEKANVLFNQIYK